MTNSIDTGSNQLNDALAELREAIEGQAATYEIKNLAMDVAAKSVDSADPATGPATDGQAQPGPDDTGDDRPTKITIIFKGYKAMPPDAGGNPATVWVVDPTPTQTNKKTAPPVAAGLVTVSECGDSWTTMGWTPEGPVTLKAETTHDEAVALAVRHARRVATGDVERESALREANRRKHARGWKGMTAADPPDIAWPSPTP